MDADIQNNEKIDETDISHEELLNITSKALNDIIKEDTILCDLPEDVTLEEVTSQVAVLHGQSMTVYVVRDDHVEVPVVVHQKGSRVSDLKKAVQRHMTMYLKRKGLCTNISWNYIWHTNNLCFDNVRLKYDNVLLSDCGIRNKSRVKFVKRQREKNKMSKLNN